MAEASAVERLIMVLLEINQNSLNEIVSARLQAEVRDDESASVAEVLSAWESAVEHGGYALRDLCVELGIEAHEGPGFE